MYINFYAMEQRSQDQQKEVEGIAKSAWMFVNPNRQQGRLSLLNLVNKRQNEQSVCCASCC